MHKAILAPDRVLLLLSLVPYLREHGPTPVAELADAFDVSPKLLRTLVRFLGTAGVPGETLSYQHEDLFDIDWDALEYEDLVSLTRTVAVDDAPRFAPAETAALIAGLQALTAVLPADYAELARETAAKLGAALGDAEKHASFTVTADAEDPRVPILIAAVDEHTQLSFGYRDAAGVQSSRTVDPISLTQESGTWYLRGFCHDRQAERTFRLDHMSEITSLGTPAVHRRVEVQSPAVTEAAVHLTASLPANLLPLIRGFDPEILDEDSSGRLRVRIAAWHERAAIQLVQRAPGSILIEAPEAARQAVRDWAARALASYDA
ncbi:WYL domain-containing protein [Leucobacter insecticola]|uniref:WYL domain-containing protein n=1 Tax=Leucobacter insecticola TaxID=2714934 RepID=A0A6G8FJC7_9MICO|nr:WYL domain-containing protein [Leucobacter insecticola]QIM16464.1 WYL domain-containing protein [Leucobacter insecticola]